jgi:hypothetical protein
MQLREPPPYKLYFCWDSGVVNAQLGGVTSSHFAKGAHWYAKSSICIQTGLPTVGLHPNQDGSRADLSSPQRDS